VICLVHRAPVDSRRAMRLPGDISQRRLGLSQAAFHELAKRIDGIIHTAAATHFGLPADHVRRVNVDGTRHILELADRAQVPLYYVSTAFTYTSTHSNQPPTPYELSKQHSDALVRDSGLPHVVVRPSLVIGDSMTGQIAQFQGIYLVLGLHLRGLLPVVPALADAFVDFIPQDVVATALSTLVRQRVTSGEHWLTLGEQALTIGEVVDLCAAFTEQFLGRPRQPVRLVAPEMFERLIKPAFLPAFPPRVRRLLERSLELTRYMNVAQRFPSSLAALEQQLGIPLLPDPRSSLLRSLAYWATTTGLSAPICSALPLVANGEVV
jgi:nucleoside-diphosphate-sugar epimerase